METLININRIEKAFFDYGKGDPKLQEYFFTYYSQKLILLNHFYPHVAGRLTGYTDHGPEHITRIIKLYEKMLKNNIPFMGSNSGIVSNATLNLYEIYLLLCATIWHDIGNLLGREKHNEKISEISDRLKNNYFVDEDMKKYALQIAEAHTGVDGVRKKIPLEDTFYKYEEINLHFLGAVLRLADELEEGEVRVDSRYYSTMGNEIPDYQKIYWEISNCIKCIEPKPDEFIIEIRAKLNVNDLFNLFEKNKGSVALIDELIFRIDKMNEERKYYMQFVRKPAEFREIIFDLVLENSSPPQQITFRFNNSRGYGAFWDNYLHMNPEKKIQGYILQKRR